MARRYYSSTAARTTLASGVDDTTNTFTVNAVSGWPTSTPYTLIIDQDTVNEEIVEVTGRTGTTITVTRGVDGTSAVAHSSGAAVNHGVSARDFDEPNAFINGTGTVTETLLASGAVTEAKLGTGAVTEAKLGTGAVTEAKLGTGAVTSAKILDGTIVNADINASAAIAQSKIANLTSDLASKADYPSGGSDGDVLTKSGTSTAWATASASGLVLITTETVSAVSSVSINGCFSATYDDYLLMGQLSYTNSSDLRVRFRVSGADNTTSNYQQQRFAGAGTGTGISRSQNQDHGVVANAAAGVDAPLVAEIIRPFATVTSAIMGRTTQSNGTGVAVEHRYTGFNATTSFDGLTLYPSAGTITGSFSIYGLAK